MGTGRCLEELKTLRHVLIEHKENGRSHEPERATQPRALSSFDYPDRLYC